MNSRMERIEKLVKQESSIILQEDVNDPAIGGVIITDIEITRDMRIAKIYCTFSDNDPGKKSETLQALKRASRFVRREISKRISLKFIPAISFREDLTEKRSRSIDEVFEKIKEEK